jgi:uncharacterized protein YaiI (UPF0178 family)
MQIWVDADACPNVVKDILYRAAQRLGVSMTLVANQLIRTPPSKLIKAVQVPAGFDVADNYIVQKLEAGDLIITADIPLASEVIEKGAHVINPRGEEYTKENIAQRLSVRDMMEELRSSGQITGGPPPLNQTDRQKFANALDRFLAKAIKQRTA